MKKDFFNKLYKQLRTGAITIVEGQRPRGSDVCSGYHAVRNGFSPASNFLTGTFALVLVFLSTEISAMSIFDAGKVCTFSNISGVILKDGNPIPNITVTRTTSYQKKKTDQTKTNDDGYFEMPALFERSALSLLPQEFVVGQLLVVSIDGTEHVIWDGVKRIKDENSESKGKPLVVTCEVNSENQVVEVDGQPFITKCTWDVVPDNVNKGF